MKYLHNIDIQVFVEDDGTIYYSVIQEVDGEQQILAYGEAVDKADAVSSCKQALAEVLD